MRVAEGHSYDTPPQMMASMPIKREQVPHVEPISEVPECKEVDQHTEPTPKVTANAPVDHLGSNFEFPDPQSQLCRSSCQSFESEYFRRLHEGQGTVDERKLKETVALTVVLHSSTNKGESPDDDDIVYVMIARVSKAQSLDPLMINEACARPNWLK